MRDILCMQTSSPVGKSCKAKDQGLSFRTLSDAFYITHISSFDIFSHSEFVFGIASFHSPRMPKMTCHLLRPVLSWISWRPSPISAFNPPAVLLKMLKMWNISKLLKMLNISKMDFLEAFPHLGVQASSCFGQDKIESETSDQCSNDNSKIK